MTNIFNRFAENHRLAMALPKDGFYNFLWPLPFQADFANGLRRPDILSNHARYNAGPLRELMPVGTRYVTILRNPVTQFSSLFKFMDLGNILSVNLKQKHVSLEYFLDNAYDILKFLHHQNPQALINNPSLYLLRNPQLFDLGFEPSLSEDVKSVQQKLLSIADHFSLVLITEYFDESLILLKRKMCWELDDVVYFTHNKQIGTKNNIFPRLQKKILRWTAADVRLYEYFNKTLWNSIKQEGINFWNEVALLRRRNNELDEVCLRKGRFYDRPYAGSSSMIYGHSLKSNIPSHFRNICKQMIRSEMMYIDYFRSVYSSRLRLNS